MAKLILNLDNQDPFNENIFSFTRTRSALTRLSESGSLAQSSLSFTVPIFRGRPISVLILSIRPLLFAPVGQADWTKVRRRKCVSGRPASITDDIDRAFGKDAGDRQDDTFPAGTLDQEQTGELGWRSPPGRAFKTGET